MRVLGIDPGLRITGYACLEERGHGQVPAIIEAGVFRLRRTAGPALDSDDGTRLPRDAASVSARLMELDRDFRALLLRVKPQSVAVEGLFAHVAHPATAMIMGHARGVLLLAVQQMGLPLVELKPAAVKKSLTGFGQADKLQMQRAVQSQFSLPELPSPPDLADAIAIALCGLQRLGVAQGLSATDPLSGAADGLKAAKPPGKRRDRSASALKNAVIEDSFGA